MYLKQLWYLTWFLKHIPHLNDIKFRHNTNGRMNRIGKTSRDSLKKTLCTFGDTLDYTEVEPCWTCRGWCLFSNGPYDVFGTMVDSSLPPLILSAETADQILIRVPIVHWYLQTHLQTTRKDERHPWGETMSRKHLHPLCFKQKHTCIMRLYNATRLQNVRRNVSDVQLVRYAADIAPLSHM